MRVREGIALAQHTRGCPTLARENTQQMHRAPRPVLALLRPASSSPPPGHGAQHRSVNNESDKGALLVQCRQRTFRSPREKAAPPFDWAILTSYLTPMITMNNTSDQIKIYLRSRLSVSKATTAATLRRQSPQELIVPKTTLDVNHR